MQKELQLLGFTGNESIVYEMLSQYTSLNGNILSQKCALDRSVTYNILNSLTKKGVVASRLENGVTQFLLTDPENLLHEIEAKADIAKQIGAQVKARKKKQTQQTTIEVLRGDIGSRVFYASPKKLKNETFYTFGGSGKMLQRFHVYFNHYAKIYREQGHTVKAILPKGYELKNQMLEHFDAEVISSQQEKFDASCSVSDEIVVFHIYEDDPEVIIIKNKAVAHILRNFFDDLWRRYPKGSVETSSGKKKT